MKLLFPQTYRSDIEAVLINTAGGITGGDRFGLDIHVDPKATLTLTTQAAERVYRAQDHEVGSVRTTISVASGASMNWLPQELILFDRSALRRHLEINLDANAQLVLVEPIVFGRTAMGETLKDVSFQDRIKISREGAPIYIDGVDLNGNAVAHLARLATANGAGAMASVVVVSPNASQQLKSVRAVLPETAGASLIADDVLVIRILAMDSFELRRGLIPSLSLLTQTPLPKSWSL